MTLFDPLLMRSSWLEWARACSVPLSSVKPGPPYDDLRRLGDMIGDATVVALSEGVHCAVELLEFRNRVLQYLVEDKGFTAIAIESGIVEGRVVHDYVRGGAGDLDSVLTEGISWGFDQAPQNRELVRWLREYNTDGRHDRKVNFYGFDVPGMPSSTRLHFGYDKPLDQVLRFLGLVDPPAGSVFRARLQPFLGIQYHPRQPLEARCYGRLEQTERDALTAAIADLIIWLERHETKYATASSEEEYAWACRAAIGARQFDNRLRHVPPGWEPSGSSSEQRESPQFLSIISDVRDRAQADNLEWIVKQEGLSGKVLVFAARYHVSAAPLKASWHPRCEGSERQVAGTYLRRRFAHRLVTIGNLIGSASEAHERFGLHEPLDRLASKVGHPLFLLDLRDAPAQLGRWLSQEHQLVSGSQILKVSVGRAFDILFYIDVVTPPSFGPTARNT